MDHREWGMRLFNETWDLIDKSDRTIEEDFKMLHGAHASRYHWGECGTTINFARGEWQISRVYALLNRPEPALVHAEHSLRYCRQIAMEGLDLAFAYEAMARAYALSGESEKQKEMVLQAEKTAETIEKEEDKAYFLKELASI